MTTQKRLRRVNDHIAEGLNSIYSFMSCEHEACQASMMECTCESCMAGRVEDCRCVDKPYSNQCNECRCHADIGQALGWIGSVIDRYQQKKS